MDFFHKCISFSVDFISFLYTSSIIYKTIFARHIITSFLYVTLTNEKYLLLRWVIVTSTNQFSSTSGLRVIILALASCKKSKNDKFSCPVSCLVYVHSKYITWKPNLLCHISNYIGLCKPLSCCLLTLPFFLL